MREALAQGSQNLARQASSASSSSASSSSSSPPSPRQPLSPQPSTSAGVWLSAGWPRRIAAEVARQAADRVHKNAGKKSNKNNI